MISTRIPSRFAEARHSKVVLREVARFWVGMMTEMSIAVFGVHVWSISRRLLPTNSISDSVFTLHSLRATVPATPLRAHYPAMELPQKLLQIPDRSAEQLAVAQLVPSPDMIRGAPKACFADVQVLGEYLNYRIEHPSIPDPDLP